MIGPSPRTRRTATQAVAVTAVVGASLAAFAGADRHGANAATPGLAALRQPLPWPAPDPIESPVAPTDTVAAAAEPVPAPILPHTVQPVDGVLTSGFGMRWGTLHAGVDFGAPIGTPIASVTDGIVVEAGPASGFGLWVRVLQDDGSIGVYGHVNDIFVTVGQPVRAGQIIATVGNRGFSTGPHLHYEVWAGPTFQKIDPLPWFAARGIDLGAAPTD